LGKTVKVECFFRSNTANQPSNYNANGSKMADWVKQLYFSCTINVVYCSTQWYRYSNNNTSHSCAPVASHNIAIVLNFGDPSIIDDLGGTLLTVLPFPVSVQLLPVLSSQFFSDAYKCLIKRGSGHPSVTESTSLFLYLVIFSCESPSLHVPVLE